MSGFVKHQLALLINHLLDAERALYDAHERLTLLNCKNLANDMKGEIGCIKLNRDIIDDLLRHQVNIPNFKTIEKIENFDELGDFVLDQLEPIKLLDKEFKLSEETKTKINQCNEYFNSHFNDEIMDDIDFIPEEEELDDEDFDTDDEGFETFIFEDSDNPKKKRKFE